MLNFWIALRLIKSNKNYLLSLSSIITIGGIAIGVMVLIMTLSILNGFEKTIYNKLLNINAHIFISGFSDRMLDNYNEGAEKIKNLIEPSDIEQLVPFIEKNAIIKSKRLSEGIKIVGMNFSENRLLKNYIITETSIEGNSIFIGKKLASKLFIEVKDTITIFGLLKDEKPSYTNPPIIKEFIVAGIYESGMNIYDDIYAYIDFRDAEHLFELDNSISGFNIHLKDNSKIDKYVKDLEANLDFPYYVRSVYQKNINIFTWIELQKQPIPIVLFFIIIIASFNLISSLLINILRKTKFIAILRIVGLKKTNIVLIFLIIGTFYSVIGILIGWFIALILGFIQNTFQVITLPANIYFISDIKLDMDIYYFLLIGALTFVISLLISIIPSLKTAAINPLELIRYK